MAHCFAIRGNIEPDKAADAGRGYAILANVTGDSEFKAAAVAIADTLARLVRSPPSSSASRSPWPFRVTAHDGDIVEECNPYTKEHTQSLHVSQLAGMEMTSLTIRIACLRGL